MVRSVDFNRQLRFMTIEIEDIGTDWVLPPKFEARDSAGAQTASESRFCVGGTAPQGSGVSQ